MDAFEMIRENYAKRELGLTEFACKSKDAFRFRSEEADLRPSFYRDIGRIIHSPSYTRYINKTQVFTLCQNDHISTRSIHVQLVSDIARDIGRSLGLNEALIEAIALGHDLGHTPLGHTGESILNEICQRELGQGFAHNIQSVRQLMCVENKGRGLNLTVQVLDGIMCHNGEILNRRYEPVKKTPEQFLEEFISAPYDLKKASQYHPMTLEGCVVRISDVIAYIGRDIEDAITLGLIDRKSIPEEVRLVLGTENSSIIHKLVVDVIYNSVNHNYIEMSQPVYDALKALIKFNYENIYARSLTEEQKEYYKEGLNLLYGCYMDDIENHNVDSSIYKDFLNQQCDEYLKQTPVKRQVIDYIAGMTDEYFIREYEKRSAKVK